MPSGTLDLHFKALNPTSSPHPTPPLTTTVTWLPNSRKGQQRHPINTNLSPVVHLAFMFVSLSMVSGLFVPPLLFYRRGVLMQKQHL